jgi:hypothetical protein
MTTILKRSKDRKVANSFTAAGAVRIANSFGLPAGKAFSCPNATSVCESICYAGKLEKLYKGVKGALVHNWDALKNASYLDSVDMLHDMLNEFEAECDKWNAPKQFRIHWDGDFFSPTYAVAWRDAMLMHTKIHFWVYTRVPSAAIELCNVPNLSLYFSTDSDNASMGLDLNKSFGIRLAFLGKTFATAKELGDGIRSAVCPEQRKQIALNGACVSCGICVKGNANIAFSISKK